MNYVLCWDIDGTLLTTAKAGIFAWEEAVLKVLGASTELSGFSTAGFTDFEIARKLVKVHSPRAEPHSVKRVLQVYEDNLPSSLHRRTGHVLPGVREMLHYLRGQRHIISMLLTGNTQAGAWAKLRHYGLKDFFELGAFSEEGLDRVSIAAKALSVARETSGKSISPQEVYVIGDTPRDVHCGKAIGARTVAVATGSYSFSELEAEDPWLTLRKLPKPERFISLLELNG